jgi:hypothetical protein
VVTDESCAYGFSRCPRQQGPRAWVSTFDAHCRYALAHRCRHLGARHPEPSTAVVDRLRFRPNIEIGLDSDRTAAAFNVEFAYHFRSAEPWSVYAGGGPALNTIKVGRDTDAEPGFNVLVGVAHEDGRFGEFKVGTLDSPRLKFGIG